MLFVSGDSRCAGRDWTCSKSVVAVVSGARATLHVVVRRDHGLDGAGEDAGARLRKQQAEALDVMAEWMLGLAEGRKEPPDHVAGQRAGRWVAASRQHQLLLISLSTSSPRLAATVVNMARAPSTFSAMTSATTCPGGRSACGR